MEIVLAEEGDQLEPQSNPHSGNKKCHRHTVHQIERLEELFKESPHPDDNQRRQLAVELGLEPRQVKFWFQNKRTQIKAQNEKADNCALRTENERIQLENIAFEEALMNVSCEACGGPSCGQEERKRNLKRLQLENARLKQQHERMSNFLAKYIGKPLSEIEQLTTLCSPLTLVPSGSSLNQCYSASGNINSNPAPSAKYQINGSISLERVLLVDAATSAMEELIKLTQKDEPFWIKSSSDDRYILHRDTYDDVFPTSANYIRSSTNNARFECSKYSEMVTMSAMQLVDMLVNSKKWTDIFPTIITEEKIIQALENGASGSRHGSLHMMSQKMHILSPLVSSREFCLLRHCRRVDHDTWMVVDVSYDFPNESASPSRCWRLPSGCMIEDMPNGLSKVTWVEHVHVDEKTLTHRLYRDLVCCNYDIAYGAERWIHTLKRMCERFTYFSKLPENTATINGFGGGVVNTVGGKQSIMNLGHRMVKTFCAMLDMSGQLDFPQLSRMANGGVRICIRESTETGQPSGLIVSAATSFRLDLPPRTVFDFFKDNKNRSQWDVLSNDASVDEIASVSTGAHPGNCVSIIRPFVPTEQSMLILQESCIDRLGSVIVYAPIDVTTLHIAISGKDSSDIPLLPSGFIISTDGTGTDRPSSRGSSTSKAASSSSSPPGTILTVAFQILVSCKQLDLDCVAAINTLVSSTAQKIKSCLNYDDDDLD